MAESPDRIENRQLKAELAEQRRQHQQLERRFERRLDQQQLEYEQKIKLMHRQCMQAVLSRGDAAGAQNGQGDEKTDGNQPRCVCMGIPMLNLYVTIA
jgi:predicted RNase H-like nuclease (RuvC/YqgF family)